MAAEGTAYAEVPIDSPWVGPGYTDEGYPYWYNNLTGESSWVDPHAPPQAATEGAGAIGGEANGDGYGYGNGDASYDEFGNPLPDQLAEAEAYGQQPPQAGAADGGDFFNAPPPASDGGDFFGAPPATAVEVQAAGQRLDERIPRRIIRPRNHAQMHDSGGVLDTKRISEHAKTLEEHIH